MSSDNTYETFDEIQQVRIECFNKKEIDVLIKTIRLALEQKAEKLNVLIKNCNVYCDNGAILVNDRYGICNDIVSVAGALGMTINPIQCSLRGKTYVVTDKLVTYLRQFGVEFEFGKTVQNQTPDASIKTIIKQNCPVSEIDQDILAMIGNIMANGEFVTTRKRKVKVVYEDGVLTQRLSEGEWTSDTDIDAVRTRLMDLSRKAQDTVNKTNTALRDGTAKLIYARARQMGYAVQEVKKGTQTQLVLVRYE